MTLVMVRRLRVEGMEPGADGPWIGPGALPSGTDEQLAVVGQLSTTTLTPGEAATRFASGGYDDHREHFDEIGLVPLELWDVLDGPEVAYTMWLYGVDGGVVFAGRSTNEVGGICQGYWDPYEDAPEDIETDFEAARVAAVAKAKEERAFPCALKSFAFI
ncbi:MAG: hypothetical protein AAGA56_06900 [Myxococcota bacterium]